MIVTTFLILVLFVFLIKYSVRRPKNFPPGPAWFPVVGNTFEIKALSKNSGGLHLALLNLSKQWKTNILGLKLGPQLVVVVFTYPLIKSVFTTIDYDARPTNFFIKLRCLGDIKGVTCTSGELWNIQRSFVVKTLRTLGLGKRATEQQVQAEINDIIDDITNRNDIRVGKLVAPAVVSILWSLITGNRLSRKDVRLNKLLDLFEIRAKLFDMAGGTLGQYPWLRFIAPDKIGYSLITKINTELKELFMDAIQEHYQIWTKEEEDSDLIFSFISEMKKENAHHSFTDNQLLMVCLDLFIAGAQTTSSTLDFAFLMMLENPDIQLKIQQLLDNVNDKHKSINYSDRHKVPYIEAVLLEAARYHSITPVIGPRRALKDVVLGNYVLPKGTTVLLHAHSVYMDPEIWTDPDVFRPERFLSPDGSVLFRDELMTFGLGRRRCPGESLAKTCTFIFFTEILRNYSIIKKPGSQTGDTKLLSGITLSAEYSALFVKRQETIF